MNLHHRNFSPDMARQPMKELPNNIEAEQALLGALLMSDDAFKVLPSGLETEHFFEGIHRAIFDAIKACVKAGKVANPVIIKSFISPEIAAKPIGDITVSTYLARLAASAVSIINVPDFAAAVIFYAQRRAAISASEGVETASWDADDELSFVDRIRESRDRLTNIITVLEGQGDGDNTLAEAVDETLYKTNEAISGRGPNGIDPGIPEVTTLTGAWQKGQLIIIGSGVKQGKSALAMQTMFNIAEKHPVGCNSGEMSRSLLIMREKARRTGISSQRQAKGSVSDTEVHALMMAGEDMKRLQFIDIDCRRMTLQQIDSKIGRLKSERGIEAYYLDHIGKLAWTGRMENEEEFKKAQLATSILHDLAQKHDIPIIAITHLKKGSFAAYQGRTLKDRINQAINRRPTFNDLLGNMDKDADQVIIPFQPRPIVAGMDPGEDSPEYSEWQNAMDRLIGKAEIVLSLSRESEWPRRKEIQWNGSTTSYGPSFNQAMNQRGLL